MTDQIIIKDLLARGVIGVTEQERQRPRDILINIILFVDLRPAGKSDDLTDTVSYSVISRQALELAESAARYTVEALASDLAQMCLAHPGVERVRVRVEKPAAVRFAASVGVEIERSRHQA